MRDKLLQILAGCDQIIKTRAVIFVENYLHEHGEMMYNLGYAQCERDYEVKALQEYNATKKENHDC